MNINKNGIQVQTTPRSHTKKRKRKRTPPPYKLFTLQMQHLKTKSTCTIPNFKPVVQLMLNDNWRLKENANDTK